MRSGSPFRSWNGVEPTELFPGVRLTAIAGEQVCLCRVTYEAGKMVPSHAHEHTEQVMAIIEGAVTITIADETRTAEAGDVIGALGFAMSRGLGLGDLSAAVFPYPTRSEVLRKLGDAFNRTRLTPWVRSLLRWWLGT